MALPRPFRFWLLFFSTAVSSISYGGQSASDLTLVPRAGYGSRGGSERPDRAQDSDRPKFPGVPHVQGEPVHLVDWGKSIDSLMPHYKLYNPDYPPQDANLDVSFRFDTYTHAIVMHFDVIDGFSTSPEGSYSDRGNYFMYRLPRATDLRRTQRFLFIPKGLSDDEHRTAIEQGRQKLDDFSRQFRGGPVFARYATELSDFLNRQSLALNWDRPKIRWIAVQIQNAFARGRDQTRGKKSKRKQPLKEHRNVQEREISIADISTGVTHPGQNSSAEQTAEFSLCLNAYNTLLSNITNLLFPVLNELIADAQDPLLYQMALSIYADITMVPQQVAGPFKNGMTAFTDIEDQYLNRTNGTSYPNGTIDTANRPDISYMLAIHGLYEELYLSTWEKAINATNSTGLLSGLFTLSGYLIPEDPSFAPPGWLDTPLSFLNSSVDFRDVVKYANLTQYPG